VSKDELAQIKDMLKEIERLKMQLKTLEVKTATDSVRGSSPFYPYIQHTITITGLDNADFNRQVKHIKTSLKDKIDTVMEMVARAQEYISTVPDADTRIILQCRFINGLTWEQIEKDTGITWTTAHRKYRRWASGQ
jgi:uncharacterized protein YqgV (UPF0045/DUF77 family)